jgi:hypothetical protein
LRLFSTVLIALMLAVWLLMGLTAAFDMRQRSWLQRGALLVTVFLLLTGAGGFFGLGLAATGQFAGLPPTFEWPVGYSRRIVFTPADLYLVAHASSRIQVYDKQWNYLRGWHVDASGGSFHVSEAQDKTFEVVTARNNRRYLYDYDGNLLESGHYKQPMPKPAAKTRSGWVPTRLFLLGFTHPMMGWLFAALGLLSLAILDKNRGTRWKRPAGQ